MTDWLFEPIEITRHLYNIYYYFMIVVCLVAIFFAYRSNLKKFSLIVWILAAIICLCWEFSLFIFNARTYNFWAISELIYHGITEAGPGLIIMLITAHKLKIIDLSGFMDRRYQHSNNCDGNCKSCSNWLC